MKLEDFIKAYNPSKQDIEAIMDLIEFKNNYTKSIDKNINK